MEKKGGFHRWVVMVQSADKKWWNTLVYPTKVQAVACAAGEVACGNQAVVQEREDKDGRSTHGPIIRVNARGEEE